jgi:hypothetical protein
MDNQDLTKMPPTDEDEDEAQPAIGGWAAFGAILLGAGFVVHMMLAGLRDAPAPGLHRRLKFIFVLLGGLGITGMALAGLAAIRKSKPKPPATQDLA